MSQNIKEVIYYELENHSLTQIQREDWMKKWRDTENYEVESCFMHLDGWIEITIQKISNRIECDGCDSDSDGEYPADHPSWTHKFCEGCKSYNTKGKWVGCEDCDIDE
tara:strand:- start:60 stop:383 length:324 start_codon:yes stop_codon:yes gene_type:complete